VILRFGIFYGHGAAHSEQIMAMARHHIGFRAGQPGSYVSSIQLADAANAVVAALECAPGTYNVVDDDPVTTRENELAMADAVGARPWISGPGRLALLLGDRTTSMTRSLRVRNQVPFGYGLGACIPQCARGLPGDGQEQRLNLALGGPVLAAVAPQPRFGL
jgi:NAD dependent epimerase/dehydratase family enzyme